MYYKKKKRKNYKKTKTSKLNDKRQRPNREFDIAMSGQFRNLAMFLILPDLSGWRMNASHKCNEKPWRYFDEYSKLPPIQEEMKRKDRISRVAI